MTKVKWTPTQRKWLKANAKYAALVDLYEFLMVTVASPFRNRAYLPFECNPFIKEDERKEIRRELDIFRTKMARDKYMLRRLTDKLFLEMTDEEREGIINRGT